MDFKPPDRIVETVALLLARRNGFLLNDDAVWELRARHATLLPYFLTTPFRLIFGGIGIRANATLPLRLNKPDCVALNIT